MKKTFVTIVIVVFLISLITVSAYAGNTEAPQYDDKIIFNETYILEENSVLDGNLMAVSSVVIIKENSIITGDVILINSSMNMDGEVNGNVMAFGGIVNLFENSVIQGDLVTPGAETYRADGSQIFGQLVTSGGSNLQISGYFDDINSLLDGEDTIVLNDSENREGNLFSRNVVLNPIARFLWIIFSSFIVSVIAVFVVLLLRKRTEIISSAFKSNPLESVGFGLVTMIIIFPFVSIVFAILAITIILIPVSLTVFIAMALLSFVGWVMACIEFGRMVTTALKQEWSDAINAGIGSFLLTFLINILNLVVWDIFGWLLGLVFTSLGVGALLLTRFGTKAYKNRSEKMKITEKN